MIRPTPVYISPCHHNLHDGTKILVRSIDPVDKPLFIQGLCDLSPQSIYYRFNTPAFKLNPRNLKYFTEVNHIDHVAIGAGIESDCGAISKGVGVGRYVRSPRDPHLAELALTVADSFQRNGVGTILLAALSRCARQQGVCFFILNIHGSRRRLITYLMGLDARVEQNRAGVLELHMPVPTPGRLNVSWQKSHDVYQEAYFKFDPTISA